MSRQISYLFTVWFSIIFLYSLWHGRISDMVTGGPFTCSLPAVPAFSPMKLLTRRKLMKFSECVHEWLISLLGLIFFVLICVTYFGGLSFSRYANATGVDRGVTAVDGEQILFLHPPSSKERHWNSSDAAVSLVWWTTDPVHWVSWPGDGLLPLHPPLWYDGKLIHSSTLIQLIFIQVLWQDKKGRHAHVQQPWSLAGPQRSVGKQEWCQSLDHHTAGKGSSYLLLCPAQGSLSTSVFITPSKPYLNQDNNILLQGQACKRGECDENTERKNIMVHLFLMKGFSENSPSKGLDT